MLKFKSCPRCKTGDVVVDSDQYGWYEYCIQCGYMGDLIGIVEPRRQPVFGVKKGKKRVKTASEGK